MRIRLHQGGLSDSIKTVSDLQDWEDFVEYCKKYNINIKSVRCEHYSGPDERIGWSDTWVILAWFNDVMCERRLPLAFSEGDVMKLKKGNEKGECMSSVKVSKPKYATPCLICCEYVIINGSDNTPKICSECRRAVLAIRKHFIFENVKLPEEE